MSDDMPDKVVNALPDGPADPGMVWDLPDEIDGVVDVGRIVEINQMVELFVLVTDESVYGIVYDGDM